MEFNINPESNIDLELLKVRVTSLTVKDEASEIEASRLMGEIDQQIDEIESSEKLVREAYEERLAELRKVKKTLQAFKDQIKADILVYKQIATMHIEDMREDIRTGKIERKEMFLDENGRLINESALSIRTERGLSSVRKHFVIKVDDFALLPDEYKLKDQKKLLAAAKKGIKKIPGVTITEKPVIQYRVKKLAS